jgi:uncharacterized protein (TIGR02996 family)
MTTKSLRASFERRLGRRPDDWGLRLVYADWLEEEGETALAAAQRYMAEHEAWPRRAGSVDPTRRPDLDAISWDWWCGFVGDSLGTAGNEGILPVELWELLEGYAYASALGDLWYKEYRSRRAAERALGQALRRQADGAAPGVGRA